MKTSDYPEPNSAREVVISVLVFLMIAGASVLFLWNPQAGKSPAPEEAAAMKRQDLHAQNNLPHFDSLDIQQPQPILPFTVPPTQQGIPHVLHAGVSPPFPALDILPVVQRVNANGGHVITNRTFTRIEIPMNAFVDK